MSKRRGRAVLLSILLPLIQGCATIPKEAPDLSVALGQRMREIEVSHVALLGAYFDEKRAAVDRYIDQVWLTRFSEEVMKEPAVASLWTQVCREGSDRDRLEFMRRLGPRIQRKINEQRQSMIEPLDELERAIAARIAGEYEQARAINNTLTSFLTSASEVDANRQRYLDRVGMTDEKIGKVIDDIDEAVDGLTEGLDKADTAAKKADEFRQKIKETVSKAKAEFRSEESKDAH